MLFLHLITGLLTSTLVPARAKALTHEATHLLQTSTGQVKLPVPHLVVKHESAEGTFNQTYHFNTTHTITGEPEIATINIFSSFDNANVSSTAVSTRDADEYGIEERDIRDWVCTNTINCWRAAHNAGGRAYTVTLTQGLQAGQVIRNWFNDGDNWRQFYTGQTVNIVMNVAGFFISSGLQKITANHVDTCGMAVGEAYKQGYADAVAINMLKMTIGTCNAQQCTCPDGSCIIAGNAQGRTYTRQARKKVNFSGATVNGEGMIHALSASYKVEDKKSQPLQC